MVVSATAAGVVSHTNMRATSGRLTVQRSYDFMLWSIQSLLGNSRKLCMENVHTWGAGIKFTTESKTPDIVSRRATGPSTERPCEVCRVGISDQESNVGQIVSPLLDELKTAGSAEFIEKGFKWDSPPGKTAFERAGMKPQNAGGRFESRRLVSQLNRHVGEHRSDEIGRAHV